MRPILFLIPIIALAQAPLPTSWDVRRNGAPTTGCKSSQDVGKRYSRINAASANATLYVCQNTAASTYAWATVGAGAVTSVFARTGAVIATTGDYTAAQVTNAADTTATYSNPAWITALAAAKLTGLVPVANLGTGTANSTTCLYGDQTYKACGSITAVQAGSVGGVVAATVGSVVSLDVDPAFVLTQGGSNAPSGSMTPSAGVWNLASVTSVNLKQGATDPATCTIGDLFTNTTTTPTLKLCTATNTWTSTPGGSGQIRTLNTGTSTASCPSAQTTLTSYSVPAATLVTGDVVDIRVVWRKTGVASTGNMKIFFGATQVGGTAGVATGEAFGFTESSVFVSSSTAQKSFTRNLRENTSITAVSTAAPAQAVSGSILIAFTGESCSGGDTLAVDWFDIVLKKNAN